MSAPRPPATSSPPPAKGEIIGLFHRIDHIELGAKEGTPGERTTFDVFPLRSRDMVRFTFTMSDSATFANMKMDTQAVARDAESSNAVQLTLSPAILPCGEVLDLTSGVAIRSFQSTSIRQVSEQVPDIKLEYFLCVPDGQSLLHVLADVPISVDEELIAALFDAMADSVRWFPDGNSG